VIKSIRDYGFSGYAFKEIVAASAAARFTFAAARLARARYEEARRQWYERARTVCQSVRLFEQFNLSAGLREQHRRVLLDAGIRHSLDGSGNRDPETLANNRILQSFVRSAHAEKLRQQYLRHGESFAAAMKFPRANDDARRQGNLVVLKAPGDSPSEKGVLYLQYTESIAAFAALFDVATLARRYRLVLEPSTWGYQDESFLLLAGRELDVLVQAQDEIDFRYIESLGCNLTPLRLGAGDWVDPDTFREDAGSAKECDFVMVASWSPMKRHRLLFESLAAARLSDARVALIGYPWDGRTGADIGRLAAHCGLRHVSIFERVSPEIVAQTLRRSRVGVMLSLREGANRGLYECLFSNVPIVLTRENRGVNQSHINARTGCLASDAELPAKLRSTLECAAGFHPRPWALQHTGRHNAYVALSAALESIAAARGESFSRPIARIRSAPYAVYADDEDRIALAASYRELASLLRAPA
jgi:glycosyltransferase involved in cell wall biosynthesis